MLVAREVKTGAFQPRVVALGTESDVVRWVPNPATVERVPAAVRQRVDSLQAGLRTGTVRLEGLDYAFERPAAPSTP
jgi:hypothetical protein